MSETEQKPLHIIELRAENVKRLKAISIRPKGPMVVIGGRNAQGKTSALDCIEMAFGGADAIPPDPVHHGARRGKIFADCGELVVERSFTPKGTSIVVKDADGEVQSSPQTLLKKLFNRIAFDPLEFSRMDPPKQDAVLKDLLGLDFSAIDAERKRLYDERTEINRDVKRLKAQVEAIPKLDDVPDEEVSVSALLEEIEKRDAVREANDERREALETAEQDLTELKSEVSELAGEIKALEERLAAKRAQLDAKHNEQALAEADVAALEAEVEKLEDPDTAEFRAQIKSADETNGKVRQKKHRRELVAELNQKQIESDERTSAIEDLDEQKSQQLEKADFPIAGLGFDETGPTFNGVPL